jgi:hypothetical protein
MADNSSNLDTENQECKSVYCEDNKNGTCTKESEDYNKCDGKNGE